MRWIHAGWDGMGGDQLHGLRGVMAFETDADVIAFWVSMSGRL
jgi:hypothetical protein